MAVSTSKHFSPQRLLQALQEAVKPPHPTEADTSAAVRALSPIVSRYWIAYSGGLDSHVLLHAMSALRGALPACDVRAVHINHGLQHNARQWEQHCARVCAVLQIPYSSVTVNAHPASGASPEAAARQARYTALGALIEPGDCLLTAHHQDDQAETLLLQLLRGAGPHGLAAMPACTNFGKGQHLRPLLGFAHAQLRAYAEQHKLHWIDDQSNLNTDFDRNYLRHEIMPRLRARWPAAARTLARSAQHAADAAHLLDALAELDLQALEIPPSPPFAKGGKKRSVLFTREGKNESSPSAKEHKRESSPVEKGSKKESSPSAKGNKKESPPLTKGGGGGICLKEGGGRPAALSITALLTLDKIRQRNVLRAWLRKLSLPLPNAAHIEHILCGVIAGGPDSNPLVHWPGAEVRRYRDLIYAMQPLPPHDPSQIIAWNPNAPLALPSGLGTLSCITVHGEGIKESLLRASDVSVRFRRGGERCQPVGHRHHHELKKLFQERGIPPWQRDRIPLIYINDKLAAVGELWVCQPFQTSAHELGATLQLCLHTD